MRKPAVLFTFLLLGFLSIAHSPTPVYAQPPSQPCAIDVTWVNVAGTPEYVSFTQKLVGTDDDYIPLTRTDNQNLRQPGIINNANWQIVQNYTTDWLCTPTLVRFLWKRETTNSGYARIETSIDGTIWTNQTIGLTNASIALNSPTSTTRIATWTNPNAVSYRYIRMIAGSAQPRIMTMEIVADDGVYEPDYITPLKEDDEVSMTTSGGNTVVSATRPFLPVHSPASASVVSINKLTSSDCTSLGVSSLICGTISLSSSLVTLSLSDGTTHQYIMATNDIYIQEGDKISAGCIMGESTQSVGYVISTIDDDAFTLSPPENAVPCREAPPPPDRCLNDGLQNESAWYRQGAVTWGDEVVLGTGGRIYQIVAIPPNATSRLIVSASGGTVKLTLGVSVYTYTISLDDFDTIQIPFGLHKPNLADFWTISVESTNGDTTIASVCLDIDEDGDGENGGGGGDYTIPANRCYFRDFGFSDTTEWALTGGAKYDTGWVILPSGGGVAQMVGLHATEWSLSIDIALIYDDDFDFDTHASESIQVSFVFPLDTPPIYNDLPVVTVGDIGDDVAYRLDTNFVIDEDDEGDFYIEITYPTLSGLDGIAITRACLRPSDGDWGDNPPPDENLPFSEYCEVISPPRGNGLGQWTRWHWHNLSQFFDCDLMVTLNNTYGLLRWFQAVLMLFMQWFGDLGVWLNGHFQNLIVAILNSDKISEWQMPSDVSGANSGISGFSSLSFAQNDISISQFESENCNWYDVFCHGRNIAGGVLDFAGGVLGDVASVLVNFIGALLAQIVDWITYGFRQFFSSIETIFNNIQDLVNSISVSVSFITDGANQLIQVWNEADPIAPPGTQDCQIDPEEKFNCLFFWMLEHTIFGGTYGTLIMPLLTSILAITGVLLLLEQFLKIVRTARDV